MLTFLVVEWIKAITELIKAVAELGTLVVVGLVLWWFRHPLGTAITKGFEFEGLGIKLKTLTKEIAKLQLDNTATQLSAEIKKVRPALTGKTVEGKVDIQAGTTIAADAKVTNEFARLIPLAKTDPRAAIRESWLLLAKIVLQAANVPSENLEPDSKELTTAFKRLEASLQIPESLIRSITNLQQIARKSFYQSK